ncbi:MAG: glutamate formimidoyltransferase [Terriglobales bacterium]
MKLVECVPNFSEGRDAAVLDSILAAMVAVPGAYLLAREMDADHHRSVVTLAGEPQAVAEAAVRGAGKAAELIDLTRHRGEHPRLGAADVIPFIPLEGTTLEECVDLAHWAGEEIWKRYGIPVYFYEAAARRIHRRKLEDVRRGQFEGIAAAVRGNPDLHPDCGGPALHPTAGASIVGARKFLIAYNINLDTGDAAIARAIARAIRASSGGLPAVKAMGVTLAAKGCAQVSMNLTDFEQTGMATVWQAVEREAARHGVHAVESELIGLAPRAALEQAAADLLKIEVFSSDRVVENRLATVMRGLPVRHEAGLQPFVRELAAAGGGLDGGSAAAATAAMAAAIGARMASATAAGQSLATAFTPLQEDLLRFTDRDSEAMLGLRTAAEMPAGADGEADLQARQRLLRQATLRAAEVALAVAVLARKIALLLDSVPSPSSPELASQPAVARHLAQAACLGACACAADRLRGLDAADPDRMRMETELSALES